MNHFIVFRQSLPVAAVYLLQSATPAVISVLLLPVLCALYNQNFGDQYLMLSALAGAFTLLLVKPPDDLTLRLSRTLLDEFGYLSVRWAAVLGVLLFIGFATKISADFSRRVITTWVVVTPVLSASAC